MSRPGKQPPDTQCLEANIPTCQANRLVPMNREGNENFPLLAPGLNGTVGSQFHSWPCQSLKSIHLGYCCPPAPHRLSAPQLPPHPAPTAQMCQVLLMDVRVTAGLAILAFLEWALGLQWLDHGKAALSHKSVSLGFAPDPSFRPV